MDERRQKAPPFANNPKPSRAWRVTLLLAVLSILLHVLLFFALYVVSPEAPPPRKEAIRIKIIPSKQMLARDKKREEEKKRIIEAEQQETEPAKDAKFLATKNHQAEKEKKAKRVDTVAKDPGPPPSLSPVLPPQREVPKPDAPRPEHDGGAVSIAADDARAGKTGKAEKKEKIKAKSYEDFVKSSVGVLQQHQVNAGYQDYLDDAIEEGEAIDLNTQEYRFISYFTGMRKAIELVWNYPLAAARKGIHGKVGLAFTVEQDGKVSKIKVLDSSGHEILDSAIVEAIRLAAPFAPLPQDMGRKTLHVTGTFSYVLR